MNVYPIPEALADAYSGAGYALAALKSGQIVDLIYLRSVLPDFSDHDDEGNGTPPDDVAARLSDSRLGPAILHLAALGEVSIGLCSAWEFNEL